MWNTEYLDRIIERTNKRISRQSQKMIGVKPGKQMPKEDQVTIGSGRQMEIAVLFLDICNYSSWFNDSFESQRIVLAIMNIFMSEMMDIIRDHRGEFEKNTGDGLMAYFGTEERIPTQCVQSAVEAALTMHYFNDNLLRPYMCKQGTQQGLKFRIGIDYGKVTVAKVGIPGGLNPFVAIGTAANIASKLLRIAGPGEIILGQHVKDYLPDYEQKYCEPILESTSFVYVINGELYWSYKYTGRWRHPQVFPRS